MAHNGKRLGINADIGGFVFMNLTKEDQGFLYGSGNGPLFPGDFYSDGYPIKNSLFISSGGTGNKMYVPSATLRPGNYCWGIKGNGTVSISGGSGTSFTADGGSTRDANGYAWSSPFVLTGRVVNDPPNDIREYVTWLLTDTGDDGAGGSHVSGVVFVHEDDLVPYQGGAIFQPRFIQTMQQFGYIRTMGMQDTNNNTCTNWSERTPVAWPGYGYGHDQCKTSEWGGLATVAANGLDVSVALTGFSLGNAKRVNWQVPSSPTIANTNDTVSISGSVITLAGHGRTNGDGVIFPSTAPSGVLSGITYVIVNAATDTFQITNRDGDSALTIGSGSFSLQRVPMLSVNGTARKCFAYFARGYFPGAYPLETVSCIYDAWTDRWQYFHNGYIDRTMGIAGGLPPEILVDLANAVDAHLWICIPMWCCDSPDQKPTTSTIPDYAYEFMVYARDNLHSGLKLFVEPCNEIWNGSFYQTTNLAVVRELRRLGYTAGDWTKTEYSQWYGMAASVIGQVANSVFSGDTTRYGVMCMCQKVDGTGGDMMDRLLSSQYVFDGGTPATDWITHVGCDGYYSSGYEGSSQETTWANSAWTDQDLADYIDGCNTGTSGSAPTLNDNKDFFADFNDLAKTYGLKLAFYETGLAASNPGPGNVYDFRLAALQSPEATTVELDFYNWVFDTLDAGVETMANFHLSGFLSLNQDPWAILYPTIFADDTPRWQVVLRFGGNIILGDYVLDNGLNTLNTLTDKILLCTSQPTDYATAVSLAVGNKTGTAIFGAPTSGSWSGQKVSLNSITDGTITTAGSVTWWAAVDSSGSNLFASGPVETPRSVEVGNFSLGSFDITLLAG